ncbi:uncharacterized protein DNG_00134 [Cephalotrichum gorgonifer]|uniref:Uncharacterized protein n=1 Tax=Cephalotrichum gorgonifer TaxID=2041049 RepID=A0AAE8MND3_9PEZI|nr:uncharacterized protein DNG_00134 [Cephalotrichum gorgonifer]
MPSLTSKNASVGSSSKQKVTKPPAGTVCSGRAKKETTTFAFGSPWHEHDGHGHPPEQLISRDRSEPMIRWLDEPVAQGPYNAIGGPGGWGRQKSNDGETVGAGAGKKRSGHKSKTKKQ